MTTISGTAPGWSHCTRSRKPRTFFCMRGLVKRPNQRKRGSRASRQIVSALPVSPGALPLAPGHVGRLHAVHEVLGAHERVRQRGSTARTSRSRGYSCGGGGWSRTHSAQSSGYSPIGPARDAVRRLRRTRRARAGPRGRRTGSCAEAEEATTSATISARSIGPKRVILLTDRHASGGCARAGRASGRLA